MDQVRYAVEACGRLMVTYVFLFGVAVHLEELLMS